MTIFILFLMFIIPPIINLRFLIRAHAEDGIYAEYSLETTDIWSVVPLASLIYTLYILENFNLKPVLYRYKVTRHIQFFARDTIVTEWQLEKFFTKQAIESYKKFGFIVKIK